MVTCPSWPGLVVLKSSKSPGSFLGKWTSQARAGKGKSLCKPWRSHSRKSGRKRRRKYEASVGVALRHVQARQDDRRNLATGGRSIQPSSLSSEKAHLRATGKRNLVLQAPREGRNGRRAPPAPGPASAATEDSRTPQLADREGDWGWCMDYGTRQVTHSK